MGIGIGDMIDHLTCSVARIRTLCHVWAEERRLLSHITGGKTDVKHSKWEKIEEIARKLGGVETSAEKVADQTRKRCGRNFSESENDQELELHFCPPQRSIFPRNFENPKLNDREEARKLSFHFIRCFQFQCYFSKAFLALWNHRESGWQRREILMNGQFLRNLVLGFELKSSLNSMINSVKRQNEWLTGSDR